MSKIDDLAARVCFLEGAREGLLVNDKDHERRLKYVEQAEHRREIAAARRRDLLGFFFRTILPIAVISGLLAAVIYYRGLALGQWS